MATSAADIYAQVLQHDLCAFIHRSFLELNPQTRFHTNWHIEKMAAQLDEVRQGRCKRLIVNNAAETIEISRDIDRVSGVGVGS